MIKYIQVFFWLVLIQALFFSQKPGLDASDTDSSSSNSSLSDSSSPRLTTYQKTLLFSVATYGYIEFLKGYLDNFKEKDLGDDKEYFESRQKILEGSEYMYNKWKEYGEDDSRYMNFCVESSSRLVKSIKEQMVDHIYKPDVVRTWFASLPNKIMMGESLDCIKSSSIQNLGLDKREFYRESFGGGDANLLLVLTLKLINLMAPVLDDEYYSIFTDNIINNIGVIYDDEYWNIDEIYDDEYWNIDELSNSLPPICINYFYEIFLLPNRFFIEEKKSNLKDHFQYFGECLQQARKLRTLISQCDEKGLTYFLKNTNYLDILKNQWDIQTIILEKLDEVFSSFPRHVVLNIFEEFWGDPGELKDSETWILECDNKFNSPIILSIIKYYNAFGQLIKSIEEGKNKNILMNKLFVGTVLTMNSDLIFSMASVYKSYIIRDREFEQMTLLDKLCLYFRSKGFGTINDIDSRLVEYFEEVQ